MLLVESLLIAAALSLNVFLRAEYEGSKVRVLNAKMVSVISLIFILGQEISFGLGYMITRVPFFSSSVSEELRALCHVLASILLMIVGAYMVYRTIRSEEIVERLREMRYKRIILETAAIALFTFACGISSGFLHLNLVHAFISIACLTILAVVLGLNVGYHQGYRFRKIGYGISSACLLFTGVEILVRYF